MCNSNLSGFENIAMSPPVVPCRSVCYQQSYFAMLGERLRRSNGMFAAEIGPRLRSRTSIVSITFCGSSLREHPSGQNLVEQVFKPCFHDYVPSTR
jgi:hypothetical protein